VNCLDDVLQFVVKCYGVWQKAKGLCFLFQAS
jgi:hypothetical protein